jgi:glycosyltransferase involved in cell wall biosynthesis
MTMARICVIRQGYFPLDPRLSREVTALIAAGHEVDVICQRRPGEAPRERNGGLGIYRLAIERRRRGVVHYLLEYGMFLLAAAFMAASLHLRHRYDVVQTNTLPDCLVFAAIVPRIFGARVLLDLHECMPEFYEMKYRLSARHPVVRGLMLLEQASIRFADFAITCTQQMRERFIERGASGKKIDVILNSFDDESFDPSRYASTRNDTDGFALVYHGTLEDMYSLDLVLRAVASLAGRIPGLRFSIYGDGPRRRALQTLAGELGLDGVVWFSDGFLPMTEVLPGIAAADVGVVAIRRDACFDLTHSNKMYDYIAMRRPVVLSRTRAVQAYFGDECFQLFESGNEQDLARAIYELYTDRSLGERLVRRAALVGEPYRWVHQRKHYVEIVERLAFRGRAHGSEPAAIRGQVKEA